MILLLVVSLVGTAVDNIGGIMGDMVAARMRKQLSARYYEHLCRCHNATLIQRLPVRLLIVSIGQLLM